MDPHDVFAALHDEGDRLDEMLGSLDEAAWRTPSACAGWSVSDVVLHLAQTEEAVEATVHGRDLPANVGEATGVDDLIDQWVASERGDKGADVLNRWRTARVAALEALRSAEPHRPLTWIAAPLKPRTLATTRLSEHWIHGLDIADPLGITYPDGERLWHIARLAHRTLPFAFARAGDGEAPEVRLELTSPSNEVWTFGPEDAPCLIRGPAGELCRVAARRLRREDAGSLEAKGPGAEKVLDLIRTYA
jgi:uncharacterized protein (TIGR03084 family)